MSAELDAHAIILARLFRLVESGVIQQPLQQEDPTLNNVAFVQQFIAKTLLDAFPHLQQCVFPPWHVLVCYFFCIHSFLLPEHRAQLGVMVTGFFTYNTDEAAFKGHLRDFLIDCKVRVIFLFSCFFNLLNRRCVHTFFFFSID